MFKSKQKEFMIFFFGINEQYCMLFKADIKLQTLDKWNCNRQ